MFTLTQYTMSPLTTIINVKRVLRSRLRMILADIPVMAEEGYTGKQLAAARLLVAEYRQAMSA